MRLGVLSPIRQQCCRAFNFCLINALELRVLIGSMLARRLYVSGVRLVTLLILCMVVKGFYEVGIRGPIWIGPLFL